MADRLTTWNEFCQMLALAHESATGAYDVVADNLMGGCGRKQALYDLSAGMREARDSLKQLAELAIRLSPPEPPARPPDAVLADIEAQGHTAWTIVRYPSGSVRVETALSGPEQPRGTGPDHKEAWIAYRVAREQGEVWNQDDAASSADVAALLEARLEQIRELHAEKHRAAVAANVYDGDREEPSAEELAELLKADIVVSEAERVIGFDTATDIIAGVGFVRIEDGQTGRFAVGELSREGDPEPWKVVRMEPGAPVVIYSFVEESDANSCRDELNGFPGPRHEPEDEIGAWVADKALARADAERESAASEEGQL